MPRQDRRGSNVGNILDTLKAYAQQEVVGPLQGAGRWLGMGVLGSLCIAVGLLLLSMSVLRALQEETGDALTGYWSWVPYLVALVVLCVFIAIAVWRMRKPTLQRKEVQR